MLSKYFVFETTRDWAQKVVRTSVAAWPRVSADGRFSLGSFPGILMLMFVLCIASTGLLTLADQVKTQSAAASRFLARQNAPLIGTLYPAYLRDKIQVLLYDELYINKNGLAWPLRYSEQAENLLAVAGGDGVNRKRPKSIFVDITFSQERPEDNITTLRDALCKIQVDWGVPVFLAALPSREGGALHVRSGLMGAEKSGKQCFTLVDVEAAHDALDGYAWDYLLKNSYGEKSAALALATDVGGLDIQAAASQRMAMDWGVVGAAPPSHIGLKCQVENDNFWAKFPAVGALVGWVNGRDLRPICAYHSEASMHSLISANGKTVEELIGGKYVFVGAQIAGLNDIVNSPVHGLLPGVHAHAMAFDNLMTLEGAFRPSMEWIDIFSGNAESFALVQIILIGVVVLFLLKYLANLLSALKKVWNGDFTTQLSDQCQVCGQTRPGIRQTRKAWEKVWSVVGIPVKFFLGALLSVSIVFFIQYFKVPIGYLPSMEFASFVIGLEALDFLDRFVKYLSDKVGSDLKEA